MIETNMFSNQIRATAEMESAQNLEGKTLLNYKALWINCLGRFGKTLLQLFQK